MTKRLSLEMSKVSKGSLSLVAARGKDWGASQEGRQAVWRCRSRFLESELSGTQALCRIGRGYCAFCVWCEGLRRYPAIFSFLPKSSLERVVPR